MSQTGEFVQRMYSRASGTCIWHHYAWQLWQPEVLAQSSSHFPSCLCLFGQATLRAKAVIRKCVPLADPVFLKQIKPRLVLKQRPLLAEDAAACSARWLVTIPPPDLRFGKTKLNSLNCITDKAIKHCRCSSSKDNCCFFYSATDCQLQFCNYSGNTFLVMIHATLLKFNTSNYNPSNIFARARLV